MRNIRGSILLLFCLIATLQMVSNAQTKPKKVDVLKQYTNCTFSDGLKITDKKRLDEDTLMSRQVETKEGPKEVTRIDSFNVLFGYPKMSPFANVRPELSQLVKDLYESDKKNVVENLRYLNSIGKESASDEPIKDIVNGFEVHQINRKVLIGSTLGITVLLNDTDNTITTIYFFNAETNKRNFQTIEEWLKLRDNFLNNYTKCINTNLGR